MWGATGNGGARLGLRFLEGDGRERIGAGFPVIPLGVLRGKKKSKKEREGEKCHNAPSLCYKIYI